MVSDRERIAINSVINNYPNIPRVIRLDDLIDPAIGEILHWVFTVPEKLRPAKPKHQNLW